MENRIKPELLAPCGDLEVLKYAIYGGADAVYLAGKSFGARAFAKNFSNEEIIEASEFVHLHHKRIYVTVNTIIFENELEEVEKYIDFLYHNVDGVIVQDFGIVHLIRTKYPDFPVHISTQDNIHNIQDLEFLKNIGINRVVLGRETPIEEVKKLNNVGIDLEVFIHGSLCFSYSGNCYLSFYHGKRSGNRGSCAQPCRKEYKLLEDGKEILKGNILSMKDLNTSNYITELLDIGVKSLKIEGRMKSKEYVYSVCRIYRTIIDNWFNNTNNIIPKDLIDSLKASYSREETKGYLFNEINSNITSNLVKHQGLLIGKVIESYKNQVVIRLVNSVSLNDGLRIISNNKEYGFILTRMFLNKQMVKSASNGSITIDVKEPIKVGSLVYKTLDSKVLDNVKDNIDYYSIYELDINIFNNHQVINVLNKDNNKTYTFKYDNILELANNYNEERIKEQFVKTNSLPFKLIIKRFNNKDRLFIPIPLINKIRTDILEELEDDSINDIIRINNYYPYKSIYNKDNIKHSIIELDSNSFNTVISYNELSKKEVANHLSEIGNNSIVSYNFNICNHLAIEFFRNITNGILILSIESEDDNNELLSKYDYNLGIMTNYLEPLMIANHCPIGKYYGVNNKHCGKCLKHHYSLIDEYNEEYSLSFNSCIMRILGKEVIKDINNDLFNIIKIK